nr:hypothetical protein [Pedobacter sp. ASV2]
MKRVIYSMLLALVVFSSCGKEDNYVPEVAVNFTTLLTDPRLSGLSSGTPVFINGYGVAGLILYRSNGRYVAYDRCSTVNPQNKCALNNDESQGITVTDPCSGAKFLLLDGSPAKAPAEKYLKQYTVAVTLNTITVSN